MPAAFSPPRVSVLLSCQVVATPTPDEKPEEASVLQDPIDRINLAVPVLAHPPSAYTPLGPFSGTV